jgi:hypothetical protein
MVSLENPQMVAEDLARMVVVGILPTLAAQHQRTQVCPVATVPPIAEQVAICHSHLMLLHQANVSWGLVRCQ